MKQNQEDRMARMRAQATQKPTQPMQKVVPVREEGELVSIHLRIRQRDLDRIDEALKPGGKLHDTFSARLHLINFAIRKYLTDNGL